MISATTRFHRVLGNAVRWVWSPCSGHRTALQLTDVPVSVLVLLACSSMSVYGVVLAGWASGSTYPLLGGLRSSAQMISYEVAMGLSIVAVFMTAGTMSHLADRRGAGRQRPSRASTSSAGTRPRPSWYAVLLLPSFIIYCIAAVGETNRAPFDLPEAESELVGGFHTEYSSFKFALFFLAEYINMITVSAFCHHAVPRRLAGPGADHRLLGGRQLRLVAAALVLRQGAHPAVRLHLAAGHPAPDALRPVHALRLEGPDPGQPGLDPLPGRRPGRQRRALDRRRPVARPPACVAVVVLVVALVLAAPARSRGSCSHRGAAGGAPAGQLPGAPDGPAGAAQPARPPRGRRTRTRPPSAATDGPDDTSDKEV